MTQVCPVKPILGLLLEQLEKVSLISRTAKLTEEFLEASEEQKLYRNKANTEGGRAERTFESPWPCPSWSDPPLLIATGRYILPLFLGWFDQHPTWCDC